MERASGILLHITSLPSPFGIGTLGTEAYHFIDFLHQAGQRYWQILPIGPTSYGDSPYQSYSTFAGNPYLIDLTLLTGEGLLPEEEFASLNWGTDAETVNYQALEQNRFAVLRKAFARFDAGADAFLDFTRQQQGWLDDYALYMALKGQNNGRGWMDWDSGIRLREDGALAAVRENLSGEIQFWQFIQFKFFQQWNRLKQYALEKGIKIIGDIPIYVAADSADVWANQRLFQLAPDGRPTEVAGCPPDAFSATGQLWGNPLYRWDVHREDGYRWWMERIRAAKERYDVTRIDHFRGFDSYYAIPYGDETAENGRWCEGPGLDFFNTLKHTLGEVPVIAEDLGYLTDSVRKLLKNTGYPGMKVLQFAFDSREQSDYLPHNYNKNCVVYTGTHDNDTIDGWFHAIPEADAAFCSDYLRLNREEGLHWGFVKAALASVGDTAIAQMQDFLNLGTEARMNTPSTVGGNWKWRLLPGALTPQLAEAIRHITGLYGRIR